MGEDGPVPPSIDQLNEIRSLIKEKVENEDVDVNTLEKVNKDDNYVTKFFRHVEEHPGDQVEVTVTMIINTLKWRKEFGAGDIKGSDFTETLLDKGSLFSRNRDKDGKKLLVFTVGKHIKGSEKMEDMKKFFVYLLERLDREGEDQFSIVFDCRTAGLKNMDMEFVQFLIGLLKDYYPDPLNYILVFEMPWVLNAAFKIIKAWLPPAAVRKIKFLTKSNMSEYIDDDNRLEIWGGSDSWEYKWEPEIVTNNGDVDETSRKKTVTFAGSPLVSSNSVESLGSSTNVVQPNSHQDILRLSPPNEVLFSSSDSGDLVGKVTIQNVSSRNVGYKIKTTSPEKYRVRPSTGSLNPGLTCSVEIHVAGGQQASLGNLVRDKFLVTAVYLERDDLTASQLAEALKQSSPDGQYRLRCQMAAETSGGVLHAPSQVQTVTSQQQGEDPARMVAGILKKVNQLSERQEHLHGQMRLVLNVEFVLVGLILLLLVVALFYQTPLPSDCSGSVPPVESNHDGLDINEEL